jgi:hypothetical protein
MLEKPEGRTTQPLISAGKTEAPAGHTAAVRIPPKRNDATEDLFRQTVAEKWRRWKQIAMQLEGLIECKYKRR